MAITQIGSVYPPNQQTPYSAYFVAVGDDASDPGTLNRAGVLAGCQNGPLKELLTRTSDWTVFNLGGVLCGAVNCRLSSLGGTGGLTATEARFLFTATGLKAAVEDVGASTSLCVEIRLSQTERY
jgi:hypothetical protein